MRSARPRIAHLLPRREAFASLRMAESDDVKTLNIDLHPIDTALPRSEGSSTPRIEGLDDSRPSSMRSRIQKDGHGETARPSSVRQPSTHCTCKPSVEAVFDQNTLPAYESRAAHLT